MYFLLFIPLILFLSYASAGTFTVDYANHQFIKDGKPWHYIAGSIDYYRIHPDYWADRMQRMRALGLNAVSIYTIWNLHETYEGNFDFSNGMANISKFLSLAQQNGLAVLLRPSPFSGVEWDYGGLPYWLINYAGIKLRAMDGNYTRAVKNYYDKLFPILIPYLYKNGGPILMIQVENEYGFMGNCDQNYMAWLRDLIWSYTGDDVVLYTTSPDYTLPCGSVPGTVTTVDFDPTTHDKIDTHFQTQDNYSNGAPHVCSEFYTDWFLQWGETNTSGEYQYKNANNGNTTLIIDNIQDYIRTKWNGSVSMLMVHGGTTFGFHNGQKPSPNIPEITTYWVGAPIEENGDITDKYKKIREYISGIPNWETPPLLLPNNNTLSSYGQVTLKRIGLNLITTLTQIQQSCTSSFDPQSFEQLNYPLGYVLYTITLEIGGTVLTTPNINDYGYVYLNNVYQGMIYKGLNASVTFSTKANPGDILRILVENGGRLDFFDHVTYPILDSKGLHSNVTLDQTILHNWHQCGINMTKESIDSLTQSFLVFDSEDSTRTFAEKGALSQPGVYAGQFNISGSIEDTYLDTSGWGKGQLFINGYNVGRYWPTWGPQVTLYVPKPFLQQQNTIVLIELNGAQQNYVDLIDHFYLSYTGYACFGYCQNYGTCYFTAQNTTACSCTPCYSGNTCNSYDNPCSNSQAQTTCNVAVAGNLCVPQTNLTYCGFTCNCNGIYQDHC